MTSVAGDAAPTTRPTALDLRMHRLGRWAPPVENPRFWATQILVVGIAVVHDSIEFFGFLPWFGGAYFLPISMFFIPVVYAALYFGLSGAVATAVWCTVLSVPNWIWAHDPTESTGAIAQMGIINLMAVFVGIRADQQMKARADAEGAWRAMQSSEARYRGLFETSGEGILALAADGRIVECNAAASRLLQASPETLRGNTMMSALSTAQSRKVYGTESLVIVKADGAELWLEPVTTSLFEPGGESQVVLRDVTEQRRRQMGLAKYAAEVVRAQEEERKRIAHELHDDTVQSLVILWRQLDEVAAHCAPGCTAQRIALLESRDLAGTVAEAVRSFAQGLRPPVLDDLGLTPAIRRLTKEFTERTNMPAEMLVHGDPRRLPPDAELALFRIAQESLRNAERHANASTVTVSLNYRATNIALIIRDDGNGFRIAPNERLTGATKLGLLGMQERARVCGGKVTIRARPGTGTTVIAKIPHHQPS